LDNRLLIKGKASDTMKILICFLCLFTSTSAFGGGRELFRHWSDLNNDGFDTRQEMLIVQSLKIQDVHQVHILNGKIISGIWVDPYTGEVVFDPSILDVDHVVPLQYALSLGAAEWKPEVREAFANDPENLLVVRDYVNRSKGASPPTEWLPPNTVYISSYIKRFITVCGKYNLPCEFDKLNSISMRFTNVKEYK